MTLWSHSWSKLNCQEIAEQIERRHRGCTHLSDGTLTEWGFFLGFAREAGVGVDAVIAWLHQRPTDQLWIVDCGLVPALDAASLRTTPTAVWARAQRVSNGW